MPFDVGDKVVYPHHGAAIIEKREKRLAFGERTEYFVLRLAYGDLTLMVPVANATEIGLREVINDEEVEEVFAVLRKKEARMPTNWSRRFKNHVEKLKSGDIYQVAEVVRNLTIREGDKGLSAGEKRMLARARQILVSELTFALDVDEEAAENRLDEVLGRPRTPLRTELADTPTKPRPPSPAVARAAPAAAGRATKPPARTDGAAGSGAKPTTGPAKAGGKTTGAKAGAARATATKAAATRTGAAARSTAAKVAGAKGSAAKGAGAKVAGAKGSAATGAGAKAAGAKGSAAKTGRTASASAADRRTAKAGASGTAKRTSRAAGATAASRR
jgi:CarD family transcriptional regulator